MRPRLSSILTALIVLTLFASCSGNRGKPKGTPGGTTMGPAAEVKQTLSTPTLAPPASTAPAAPAPEAAPTAPPVEAAPPPPRGPVTIISSPEETASPATPAPAPATPPAPAFIESPAPPAVITPIVPQAPQAPQAAPAPQVPATAQPTPPAAGAGPLATPPEQGAAPPPPGVAALPAPAVAPPEAEKPAEAQAVTFQPKLVLARTDIDILVDASGSMAAPFATGARAKLDLVRDALSDIVFEMSQQQADFPRNIAVRVFGAGSPASDDNRQDSQLIAKMGAPDLGGIRNVLGAVEAKGLSPIAYALTEAMNDFPGGSTADRVIVLLADGADNTEGDPCAAVAEKIEAGPVKTTIHVVAFDVNPGDLAQLECIAKKGDGMFFLARNEAELRSALDQAINSTIPYNLKLTVTAGSTPIPFNLTVFKGGTEQVVRHDKGFGTKLLRLDPGSHDLLVEYADSPERKKPSKILKGVEIPATAKVEQTITFDLGQLTLSAVGGDGSPAAARLSITKAGTVEPMAQLEGGLEPLTLFLTPGLYDISADLLESQLEGFSLAEKGVEVKLGEAAERTFRFQKGTLSLKGITTQKEALPFIFQIFLADRADLPIASGAFPAEGGQLQIAPGLYDLLVIGTDPKMAASPRTKVSRVEVRAAGTTEVVAAFEMGVLKLSAIDGKGGKLPAQFVVRDHDTQAEMARISSENGDPVQIPIPPGTYDIVASSLNSILEPKPSVPVTGVVVTADKPVEQVIKFILGTLKLRGRNAKEQPMQTQFTIYRAGSDEVVAVAPASGDWMTFDLAPGIYDALAVNTGADEKPQPMIWLRDLKVEDGKVVSHEAIFTAGKLKIIGRGPNNQIITCSFRVFQYGKDRELINGTTGQDWEVFEIQPGKYYLEAGFHDDAQSVLLKQWVNISVGENEVVEVVLRF